MSKCPDQGPERRAGSSRPHSSGPELDRAELDWWERFADVEDRYCWVQTPAIQRFLRGAYVRKIVKAAQGRTVLEIGCGSGWLCLLLARPGAVSVEGLDPSSAQIARACQAARDAGLSHRVSFRTATLPDTGAEGEQPARYDVLVLHAVLHHLAVEEIQHLLATFVERLACPGAQVFILEPINYRADATLRTRVDRLIDRLVLLPRAGRRLKLRQVSPAEDALRSRIDARGDSPKEAPFLPGELEQLVTPFLHVNGTYPVLNFSYLGAKNALLMQHSHPTRARLWLWPYLCALRALELWVLQRTPGASWLPTFVLFECRLRQPA